MKSLLNESQLLSHCFNMPFPNTHVSIFLKTHTATTFSHQTTGLEGIYKLFVIIIYSPNDDLLSELSSFIRIPPNVHKQDFVPTINQSLDKDAIFIELQNSRTWC
ncbi:hypothetical protein BLNAU_17093 [Blattamonas nauphoetae]|uniref:Uncharacterized protein n=1 Tax=Blattamonas nauphoetae TaxID=2049346 RepID=A0ABQ9X998_9EUKA|nr:hypothetical protein BLNAU_17093 [Blattamonas nauphoetae]